MVGIRRRCALMGVVVGLLLGGAACGDDEPASPPVAWPPVEEVTLGVMADGVVVVRPDGSTSTTMFGTIEGDVVAEVGSVLGDPIEKGLAPECSPTAQFVTFPGITISLLDGIFVGWTLRPDAAAAITTADGIGPGSTLAELDASYGVVTVDPTSALGVEFAADDVVFGTLDSTGPDARIDALWAGDTCVAR